MAKLFPEILAIEEGHTSSLAKRVKARVQGGNPQVQIKTYDKKESRILNLPQQTPKVNPERVRWEQGKKALILRAKAKDKNQGYLRFLHVFVAVGDVVEDYQFTVSIENECPYRCEFCYIQAAPSEKFIPTIFTNLQDEGVLLREVKIALLAMHMHTQTHNIKYNIGRNQQGWVHYIMGILNTIIPREVKDVPIQALFDNSKSKIMEALSKADLDVLKPIINNFENFDFTNLTHKFKFNCGEINDALVNDHLTDNSKFLVELFSTDTMKKDGAILLFRTKSDNFDNLKILTPGENVRVSVTVLPATFVKGPPIHIDRLKGANELLKLGYKISLNIDPIILEANTLKTYKKIIDDIKSNIDYTSDRFHRITIGMLRFGEENLKNNIRKRHVGLYRHAKDQMDKVKGDEKYRYDRNKRIEIYKALVEYIQSEMPGIEVELSTEPVDVWTDVGLTP